MTLWGTRGSVPTPPSTRRRCSPWGGNTPCVQVEVAGEESIILDAGMGLHWLARDLLEGDFGRGAGKAHLLLSHLHWGHIQGIPFFPPMLIPGNRLTFYGPGHSNHSLAGLLAFQMNAAYCPVPDAFEKGVGAGVEVHQIGGDAFRIGRVQVTARPVNHAPDSTCLGYRLDCGSASLAYLPDVEYLEPDHRTPALELASGVDLLVHDAHYTREEYRARRRWGHCCDRDAVEIALEADVRRLLLFHHAPGRDEPDRYAATLSCFPDAPLFVEPAREGAQYEIDEGFRQEERA